MSGKHFRWIGLPLLALLIHLPLAPAVQNTRNAAARWQKDFEAVTAGVKQVASPGLPGVITTFLDRSFVVVAGRNDKTLAPVVAAGEMAGLKKGRIVAFGHDGYLAAEAFKVADTGRLALNLARWAAHLPVGGAGGTSSKKSTLVLVNRPGLAGAFQEAGWAVKSVSSDWPSQLDGASLVVLSAGEINTKPQAEALRKHLVRGGGVMIGITGWGWEQVHPGKRLATDFAFTPVLLEAGLAVSGSTADPTDGKLMGIREFGTLALVHSGEAFERLKAGEKDGKTLSKAEMEQVGASMLAGLRSVPAGGSAFRTELTGFLANHKRRVISANAPVDQADIMDRLAIQLDHELDAQRPADQIKANPSAADFPGKVPAGAPRVARKVALSKGSKGRVGTGLYAAPGTLVKVRVVQGELPANVNIRIGAHSDTTWHLESWQRHPEISRVWPVSGTETPVASAFGGLIYVELPRPLQGDVELEVKEAVAAPHFVLGQTTPAEWKKLRGAPAPWAELQSRHVGLVLPAESVRKLDDLTALLTLWDKVMETQTELGTLNREYIPTQWIVPDRQISAGYMHSGNPIMTFLDVVPYFSSAERLMKSEPGGVTWGILHEIGHNRQRGDWTPDGLGEVTNNLFALYVYDRMLGKPSSGHPGLLTGDNRARAVAAYRKTGPDFNRFKSDPFLALAFFMEMQESFGWEPFSRFFAESEKKPRGDRPRTDVDRWDAWLVGMSRQTGKNLAPFFQLWGVPLSGQAVDSVKNLADWVPGTRGVAE